jgi:hypothetical protein
LTAQQESSQVAAFQTCFDATELLFLEAESTGVDLEIYTKANGNALDSLNGAQNASNSIVIL